ncbi:HlyD family secretion protein, partial [Mesorhizobium sp. M7A.T.Ca.TU.009.01.1.2]
MNAVAKIDEKVPELDMEAPAQPAAAPPAVAPPVQPAPVPVKKKRRLHRG